MCTWKYATMKHLNACLWEADSMRQETCNTKERSMAHNKFLLQSILLFASTTIDRIRCSHESTTRIQVERADSLQGRGVTAWSSDWLHAHGHVVSAAGRGVMPNERRTPHWCREAGIQLSGFIRSTACRRYTNLEAPHRVEGREIPATPASAVDVVGAVRHSALTCPADASAAVKLISQLHVQGR
jgi:hypothetical protein